MTPDNITVAVTAFRRPAFLRRALESVRAAGLKAVCVSADDDPEVLKVLKEFEAKTTMRYGFNQGADMGCNASWLAAARTVLTPYMILLHDDDELKSWTVQTLRPHLADAEAGNLLMWDGIVARSSQGDLSLKAMPGDYGIRRPHDLLKHLFACPRSLSPLHALWKTSHVVRVLEECEDIERQKKVPEMLTRPGMMVGNDLLLWLRAIERAPAITYVDKQLAVFHAHPGSETCAAIADPARGDKLHAAYSAAKTYFALSAQNKLRLNGVTAVVMESLDPDRGARVLNHCETLATFDAVRLIAPRRPTVKFCGEFIQVPVSNYIGYSTFSCKNLWRFIDTSHALVMQHDGFIIHPEMWNPRWTEYDYIGAPWPVESLMPFAAKEWRVGNSGFSLRSSALMRLCGEIDVDHNNEADRAEVKRSRATDWCADDVWICQRPDVWQRLVENGMKFAPVEVAMRFSLEDPIPECAITDPSFGFHSFRFGREKFQLCAKK